MLSACQIIGLETCNVQVLDDDRIPDGPHVIWEDGVVSGVIEEYLVQSVESKASFSGSGCVRIITFDEYGVSGHPNHCDTSRGVCRFLYDVQLGHVDLKLKKLKFYLYRLRSVPVWRKYCVVVDLLYEGLRWFISVCFLFIWGGSRKDQDNYFFAFHPKLTWMAMAAHHSQFVWYRRLSVLFSRYTYINSLDEMKQTHINRSCISAKKET